jgi:hypothetical protein
MQLEFTKRVQKKKEKENSQPVWNPNLLKVNQKHTEPFREINPGNFLYGCGMGQSLHHNNQTIV